MSTLREGETRNWGSSLSVDYEIILMGVIGRHTQTPPPQRFLPQFPPPPLVEVPTSTLRKSNVYEDSVTPSTDGTSFPSGIKRKEFPPFTCRKIS